jgi:glycine C-acetyltransferase
MQAIETYDGGENFDLRQMLLRGRTLRLRERTEFLGGFLNDLNSRRENLCMRTVTSPAGREVTVIDPYSGKPASMLMFGANNYLGLANHPLVRQKVQDAVREYGVGIGGPPLLNGYTRLHRELEERLAALKGTEDALVFSSGYAANVGIVSGLVNPDDMVCYDAYSHASFCDGIRMSGAPSHRFRHNDINQLQWLLQSHRQSTTDTFVGVEGVYSMDGDLAPLDLLIPLCKKHSAILVVDDAHGTCVMGATGRGTAEHFGVEGQVDITMGTFSKAFAVTGGFVAASKSIIDYLRYFARTYMFSASMPPMMIAAVLAGLDVVRQEPELLHRLRANVQYASEGLSSIGIHAQAQAAIIPLRVPAAMNMRRMAYGFHKRGIFVNSVEYPAVPVSQQRFRVSIMATHTREDIDRLVEAVAEVWKIEARNCEALDEQKNAEAKS